MPSPRRTGRVLTIEVAKKTSRGRGLPIVYRPGAMFSKGRETNGSSSDVRAPKTSESTAAAIVADIVSQGLAVGDRLPPESEMLASYGVSRESLREALRILEVQGLIYIKRGPGGGPFVSALNASYLARTATLYFNLSGATYAEVFETWAMLEPSLSAKVARLPDKRLKQEAFAPYMDYDPETHGRDEVFSNMNDFHAVIADLSGNRVLTLLTQAVNHIVVDHVLNDMDPVSESDRLVHSHVDIANAIIACRPVKAASLMEKHITEVTDLFRDRNPQRMQDPIEWR